VARVIECVEAHYEIQDVEFGKVYRWCPERALVKCDCRETLILTVFRTTCGKCELDHASLVGEWFHSRPEDKVDHPWRYLQPCTPTRGA
jgi:hypothetical protein